MLDSRSWDRNPADSNANARFYHSVTRKLALAKEFLNPYVSHLFCLHISAKRLPRAQFIQRALLYASGSHYFFRYIYIYIFRSQLRESSVSSHIEELWYNETVCLWMTIYMLPYPGRVELSSERSNGCNVDDYRDIYSPTPVGLSSLANWSNRVAISVYCKSLHIWIEVSVAIKRIYVNNSNCDS